MIAARSGCSTRPSAVCRAKRKIGIEAGAVSPGVDFDEIVGLRVERHGEPAVGVSEPATSGS